MLCTKSVITFEAFVRGTDRWKHLPILTDYVRHDENVKDFTEDSVKSLFFTSALSHCLLWPHGLCQLNCLIASPRFWLVVGCACCLARTCVVLKLTSARPWCVAFEGHVRDIQCNDAARRFCFSLSLGAFILGKLRSISWGSAGRNPVCPKCATCPAIPHCSCRP